MTIQNTTWMICSVSAALIASTAAFSPADAQENAVIAGTLTCTATKPPQSGSADVALSCNFASRDGSKSDYMGEAKRVGAADFPAGKHVWLWNVVAPKSKDAPPLEGTFRGETGGAGAGILLGGPENTIRLESVSGSAQVAGPPALTVLTLSLVAKKA